jgi:hypothetical protein
MYDDVGEAPSQYPGQFRQRFKGMMPAARRGLYHIPQHTSEVGPNIDSRTVRTKNTTYYLTCVTVIVSATAASEPQLCFAQE